MGQINVSSATSRGEERPARLVLPHTRVRVCEGDELTRVFRDRSDRISRLSGGGRNRRPRACAPTDRHDPTERGFVYDGGLHAVSDVRSLGRGSSRPGWGVFEYIQARAIPSVSREKKRARDGPSRRVPRLLPPLEAVSGCDFPSSRLVSIPSKSFTHVRAGSSSTRVSSSRSIRSPAS